MENKRAKMPFTPSVCVCVSMTLQTSCVVVCCDGISLLRLLREISEKNSNQDNTPGGFETW